MRINITLDDELVRKLDAAAEKMYVSRSGYIAFAVSQKIQADEALTQIPQMIGVMRDAVELEKDKVKPKKKASETLPGTILDGKND